MAHQSLYRKYRPQTFPDVVGQDHITRTLRNAVEEGAVAHAYLFCGPRGTGKTTTARILAKALDCVNGPTPMTRARTAARSPKAATRTSTSWTRRHAPASTPFGTRSSRR
jgi:DNA polymerase III gamma/tau subunit